MNDVRCHRVYKSVNKPLTVWGAERRLFFLALVISAASFNFFGSLMSVNYLLAGTVSSNPILFVLATWLVLAWRVAGWWGLDRWLLPLLGTPWAPGQLQSPSRSEEASGPVRHQAA